MYVCVERGNVRVCVRVRRSVSGGWLYHKQKMRENQGEKDERGREREEEDAPTLSEKNTYFLSPMMA